MAWIVEELMNILNNAPWLVSLLISIVGSFIAIIILGTFKPVRQIYYWFLSFIDELKKRNMNLNVEMNTQIELSKTINVENFGNIIRQSMSEDNGFVLTKVSQEKFETTKKLEDCSVRISFLAIPKENDEELEQYNCINVSLLTRDLKTKKLREGLIAIQNLIFQDIFLKINKVLKADITIAGVTVNFSELPELLKFIADFKLKDASFEAKEKDLKIVFQKDKIRFIGKIDKYSIDKVYEVVKKNLFF